MDKKFDLYITFPEQHIHADSKLFQTADTAVGQLKLAIARILKRDIAVVWKGDAAQKINYRNVINESRLVVFFAHPEFELDEAYTGELEYIGEMLSLSKVDLTEGYGRIFKICLEPLKKPLHPFYFEELLSYDFFEKNIYNRKTRSFDFESADKSFVLYSRLLDLAYDISTSLRNEYNTNESKDRRQRFVFLGLTTSDQQQARDDIKRELQHYGFRVLPYTRMPQTGEEFEKMLVNNLERADIVVQLMGAQYGEMLKGTKYSMPDFQNRIIREYQEKNEHRNISRFIWIPVHNKMSDQRQALYLKRLRRDDATVNTEIIESPLETFKTILSTRLENTNHLNRIEYENISKVYLLTEERALQESEELYSTLSLSGLKVYQLDYEEQVGIYARHLKALRDSDAVVIFQTSENQFWLNSKLRDIIKSPGIGRTKPFKKIVIASRLNPDPDLVRMIKSRVELMNNNGTEPEQILNKLVSE